MRTLPRRFRPHSIEIIKQSVEDENGISNEHVIIIGRVKVDQNYGIQQSKRGITTDDKIIVYIELTDYEACDCDERNLCYGSDFTITTNDRLKFGINEYQITSISNVLLDSSAPVRLEIIGK